MSKSKRPDPKESDDREVLALSAWDDQRSIGVKLEDDGRAAFAYMWDGEKYLSAVWLYNHPHAEVTRPRTPDDLPTPNPPEFILEPQIAPVSNESEVQINFRGTTPTEYTALIYIRDRPHACLAAVEKIGWCVSARGSGPYAKAMTVAERTDGKFSVKLE